MIKKVVGIISGLLIVVLAVLFITIISGCDSTSEPQQWDWSSKSLSKSERLIVDKSDVFGIKLLTELNKTDKYKNIFISPLSISLAMGMAVNGANGATYNELIETLGWGDLTLAEINSSSKSLVERLTNVDPKVDISIANSVWYREGMPIEKTFLDINQDFYNAQILSGDFSNTTLNAINSWVKEKTKNKIEKILDEIHPNALAYLINAIYFKADWKYKFDESKTVEQDFQLLTNEKVKCKMMQIKGRFNYYSDENIQIVDLPYGDSLYVMSVILPKEKYNVDQFLIDVNSSGFNPYFAKMKSENGTVYLPKFQLEYDIDLIKALAEMGIKKAVKLGEADFTKMIKNFDVAISKVKHKTFVQVDEKGTEASAATAVELVYKSVIDSFTFNCNHPFAFVIREVKSNTNLFIGKVFNPNTK